MHDDCDTADRHGDRSMDHEPPRPDLRRLPSPGHPTNLDGAARSPSRGTCGSTDRWMELLRTARRPTDMTRPVSIRVLLADNHPVYCEGLAEALKSTSDLQLVAVCAGGEEAYDAILELHPHVAVLDQRMPDLEAWEVVARLRENGSATRVLVLSAFAELDLVRKTLEAGAAGYLTKDADREAICAAVRRVADGEIVLGPELQGVVVEHLRGVAARERSTLSNRELEILEMAAEGLTVAAMAKRLYLSPATVKTHLNHVYEKLDVRERAGAVAEGMRRGLLR
jgi:two-component system, NarL family, nitrate/nitrite response regulator NarL